MINADIIQLISARIQAMDYGETITHQQLAADLGVRYGSCSYRSAVSKLQRDCLEHGKLLENIVKVGYRVTRPDDYTSRALRQYNQGARRIKKGSEILKYAPTENMSQQGLAQYRDIADRARTLEAHMSGAIVEMKLLRKAHPLTPK